MQRWEYMTWVVGYTETTAETTKVGRGQGGVVKYRDDEELPDWKDGLSLSIALREAGAQGWELVSFQYPGARLNSLNMAPQDALYVFKRPARD